MQQKNLQEFTLGQRWISAAELHLGIGMVIALEHRTVSIIFPATTETRIYAKDNSPLTRVLFESGDSVEDQQKLELKVISVSDHDGLVSYHCEDADGKPVLLPEGKLSNFIQLNRPAERLLNGQIDHNKWFDLRRKTQEIATRISSSSLYGLTGCRTSLIDHQVYIAHEVANRYAPRVLLADEVGLGKTIEAGLIMHQQLLTERVGRVLIVVPESLVHQWLVELLRRFNLFFNVFNEQRYDAIQHSDGEEQGNLENPFHSEQLVLCSLEFLVEKQQRADFAIDGEWDLLIVDEAHHLVWDKEHPSDEYQLIEKLASTTRGVLLLTATPEQLGKASHFARLRLLDRDRFNDLDVFLQEEKNYQPLAEVVDVLLSQQKMNQQQQKLLTNILDETELQLLQQLETDEDGAYEARQQLVEQILDRHGTGRVLFRNTRNVIKGFPAREVHAYPLPMPEVYQQIFEDFGQQTTDNLQLWLSPETILQSVSDEPDSWGLLDPRVEWLSNFLRQNIKQKVLVICHNAQTAIDLVAHLKQLGGIQSALFHEGLSLIERDKAAAWFADFETGTQVLICSEIGSEGRNFQFSHNLVLFDLPLNPDLLEQRIGRLDRIGQNAVINIHVPYLENSAQQIMYSWYHHALNAFEHTCPVGQSVYMQMHHQLQQNLQNPDQDSDEMIKQAAQLYQQLNEELQRGRDRLLEYNSCRPLVAENLITETLELEQDQDIFRYMERIYDCYGIDSEIRGQDCWVLHPSDNMITKIPGLPDDGMTVTYKRSTALSNEDVKFLSWEHPFVRNAMDLIRSSEFGNTALMAIKYPSVQPGTMLLECQFILEIADNKHSQNQRYFPNALVRVVIDEQSRDHNKILHKDAIRKIAQFVDATIAVKVVKSKQQEIKQLLQTAESHCQQQLPEAISNALKYSENLLGSEINRLQALQKLNANIRDEEIEFFQNQLAQVKQSIKDAAPRLDAIRLMIAI